MSTRGYNTYHGKMPPGKKALIIVLCVVLVLAILFLISQKYVVYDSSGHATFSFLQKKEPATQPEEQPAEQQPIEVIREEPAAPKLTALNAQELYRGFAPTDWESAVASLAADTAVVVDVKNTEGDVIYGSTIAHPGAVAVGTETDSAALKQLTATSHYTIARVACFWDLQYAYALPAESGICTPEGKIWYDNSAECWLDPGKEAARTYLISLCKEVAALGFDEILLDYCSYPTTGNFARLDYGTVGKTENLTAFVKALKEALKDTDVVLSVAVHNDPATDSTNSGQTVEFLTGNFDRIYVDTDTVDLAALTATLPTDYDTATRLVSMGWAAPASGSYMIRTN
jgi:hypothetical protein